jgi:3'-phosphoadenosine 5'-phosphosulfate sulfotransferase (PAPS reductase)/FAD synthetase
MKTIICMLVTAIMIFSLSACSKREIGIESVDIGIDNMFSSEYVKNPINKPLMENFETKAYEISPLKQFTGIDIEEYIEPGNIETRTKASLKVQ